MRRSRRCYGWGRIQTPGFEDTGLFARTSGAASDVVHKEMYSFTDRSDRSLTLRPEGTAPIARAYVEHGLHREPQPVKAYTIAPMYRYGAPGLGRYREHYQLSVEAIGSADPAIDAEVIQLYSSCCVGSGVTQWELLLNSIGDANCRPAVRRAAERMARRARGRARRGRAPQARDEPAPGVRREGRSACARRSPTRRRSASRCATPAASTSTAVTAQLDALGVPYVLDPTLVRGLDYYTRTTFEFVGPFENANSAICGGGRYDGLVEQVGGPPTPGIGFGAGHRAPAARARERGSIASSRTRARRLLRARRRRRPRRRCSVLLAELRRAGHLGRHRLRGAVVQGADDAGRANARARGRDRRRRRGRDQARRPRRAAGRARRRSSLPSRSR